VTFLHRYRFVLLAVTGVVLIGATVYTYAGPDRSQQVAGRLGPTPGPDSQGHIRAQRAYLEGLAKTHPTQKAAALVSLTKYVPASVAQSIARSMDATVVFVKFPKTDQELQFVRSSIPAALSDRSTDLRHEIAAEIDALKAEARKARGKQQRDLEALVVERRHELDGIEPDCECVFAFAVENTTVEALESLAKRPEVRLVDVPDPVTDHLAGWELQPIVPKA